MTSIFLENLSLDFIKLLENADEYNVIIEIGEDSFKKSFKAHTAVLCYRCSYLYDELKSIDYNDRNIKVIKIPNISAEVFNIIIRYIYGGTLNLENVETSFLFDLLISANKFGLKELSKCAESYLIDHQSSWLRLNFSRVYQKSCGNNDFTLLQEFYDNIITKHPSVVFDSNDFLKLNEKALVSILKRDDLQLEEAKIWDYVVRWGVTQSPALPSILEQWKDTDFLALKETLKNCLPHIRFFQIPSREIFLKIRPYRQILEIQLWTDINSKIMAPDLRVSSVILPPRKILSEQLPIRNTPLLQFVKISSEIITVEQATEIISWINKEKICDTNDLYEFRLIRRHFNSEFSIRNLVVIAQVEGTDEILGGYNPIGWAKPNPLRSPFFSNTCDSLIFSLQNRNIKESIISRVKKVDSAIKNSYFGLRFGHTDLHLTYNSSTGLCGNCKKKDYERSIRDTEDVFRVNKVEIFQIIKTQRA